MSIITQISQSSAVFSLARRVSETVAVAREIANDIKNIFHRTSNEVPQVNLNSNASEAGKASTAKHLTLTGFRELGDRAKGVEAGITAKKEWTDAAVEKLLCEPKHPFNDRALGWLSGQLDLRNESKYWLGVEKSFKVGLEELSKNEKLLSQLDETSRQALDNINIRKGENNDFKGLGNSDFKDLPPELKNAVFQEALKSNNKDGKFLSLRQIIKNEILEKESIFKKKEYIELPDIKSGSLLGRYLIFKAKITGKISSFQNMINKLDDDTRKATRIQASVRSYVNNLVGKLGMNTHKLEIHHFGGFTTGTAVLHSTRPEDFAEFSEKQGPAAGRPFRKDGVLVQHTPNEKDPTLFDGPLKLCNDIKELGRSKIILLLLGDQDPLKNKGIVTSEGKTHFFSNDSKSFLNEDLLGKRIGVNSDFSLNSASQQKNFSIYDQSTLAEKMEGVRQIQQLKENKSDPQEKAPSKTQSSTTEQSKIPRVYIERREEILEIFKERLAVDDFNFGPTVVNVQDKNIARDQTLNLLDGLEKLSSETVGTANGKENGIRLDIPQVQDRKAWNVQQDGDQIRFTFEGKTAEAGDILKTLQDYSAHVPSTAYNFRRGPDNFITVSVNVADLKDAQSALSYKNIMDFKHPSTTS